jgi:hypothetical protein
LPPAKPPLSLISLTSILIDDESVRVCRLTDWLADLIGRPIEISKSNDRIEIQPTNPIHSNPLHSPTPTITRPQKERSMQTRLPSQALRLLWAFDFDGVVCHSAKELCLTGQSVRGSVHGVG